MLINVLPLVIKYWIANHEVLRITIDKGSSCDIINACLFEELGLKKENLSPYQGIDPQAFNDSATHPWGNIEFMISLGEGKRCKDGRHTFLSSYL